MLLSIFITFVVYKFHLSFNVSENPLFQSQMLHLKFIDNIFLNFSNKTILSTKKNVNILG